MLRLDSLVYRKMTLPATPILEDLAWNSHRPSSAHHLPRAVPGVQHGYRRLPGSLDDGQLWGDPAFFDSTVKTQLDRIESDSHEEVFAEGQAVAAEGELTYSEVRITSTDGRLLCRGSTIYRSAARRRAQNKATLYKDAIGQTGGA